MKAKFGIQVLVIDYLQLINAGGKTDFEKATASSQFASGLIKELGVAGIVLAQLGRDCDKRDNKRPNMSDLRSSGQIEQDADAILLLYREDYYRMSDPARRGEDLDGIAELNIAKLRDGEREYTVMLNSILKYQRFVGYEVIDRFSI